MLRPAPDWRPKLFASVCGGVPQALSFRVDAIGAVSVLGNSWLRPISHQNAEDIRLRFCRAVGRCGSIEMLLDEVEALYCAGPAGGAGVRRRATPRLASAACLVERRYAETARHIVGSAGMKRTVTSP